MRARPKNHQIVQKQQVDRLNHREYVDLHLDEFDGEEKTEDFNDEMEDDFIRLKERNDNKECMEAVEDEQGEERLGLATGGLGEIDESAEATARTRSVDKRRKVMGIRRNINRRIPFSLSILYMIAILSLGIPMTIVLYRGLPFSSLPCHQEDNVNQYYAWIVPNDDEKLPQFIQDWYKHSNGNDPINYLRSW